MRGILPLAFLLQRLNLLFVHRDYLVVVLRNDGHRAYLFDLHEILLINFPVLHLRVELIVADFEVLFVLQG